MKTLPPALRVPYFYACKHWGASFLEKATRVPAPVLVQAIQGEPIEDGALDKMVAWAHEHLEYEKEKAT